MMSNELRQRNDAIKVSMCIAGFRNIVSRCGLDKELGDWIGGGGKRHGKELLVMVLRRMLLVDEVMIYVEVILERFKGMDFKHSWKLGLLFVVFIAGSTLQHHNVAAADLFMNNNTVSFGESLAVKKGARPWIKNACGTPDGTKCQFSSCGEGHLLPNCAIGFARGVTGGQGGLSYTVTRSDDNPNDPAPGTLRYGVSISSTNPKGVWITFSQGMTIRLQKMLLVFSHTTIDGRGVRVIITGSAIGLNKVQNVIIHNIQVSDSNFDTVHILGSKKVWVDHLTSFGGKLGLVSAVHGSTDITISNCRLFETNFNMLLGAQDSDKIDQQMRVTVYRNWFKDSNQRNPHCRWGYCHVVNNLYGNWGIYAIGARVHARIYSERNVFVPGKNHEVTEWYPGYESKWDTTPKIQSTGDQLVNGATFHQFLYTGRVDAPPYKSGQYPPLTDTERVPRLVGDCSGVLLQGDVQTCLKNG
ncbi:hypothetical protein SUGI_0912420 [Cryptomeria japonica]|nr:hypothetical protein SUGI_0912420 [Cryptomeria japonica]